MDTNGHENSSASAMACATSQSDEAFKQALDDLRSVLEQAKARAVEKAKLPARTVGGL